LPTQASGRKQYRRSSVRQQPRIYRGPAVNGYSDPFRLDRNRHSGGILAFVKNDIFCVRRYDFEANDVEVLWL